MSLRHPVPQYEALLHEKSVTVPDAILEGIANMLESEALIFESRETPKQFWGAVNLRPGLFCKRNPTTTGGSFPREIWRRPDSEGQCKYA